MSKKMWIPVPLFVGVLVFHVAVTVASFPSAIPMGPKLLGYFKLGSFWLGYSYALAAAFTAYAVLLSVERSPRGMAGAIAGASWVGLLYAAGCWAVGCCGSPLLAVYLGALGSRLLGFTQPIVAAVTTLSVLGAFLWMRSGTCRIARPSTDLNTVE